MRMLLLFGAPRAWRNVWKLWNFCGDKLIVFTFSAMAQANQLTQEYKEFVELLNANGVEYMVVGADAVARYGYMRATGDIDIIWIRGTHSCYLFALSCYT
ncbi:hypothetical protein [Hymenobacter yonginensis]|uniref:Uncharacterized protein n=1 Tax=Hymenobacter yonginensis TaxID=748197 RepID=A0ABY7PIJ0_9BACT|nr:hypothetical protein [Hymenobacter yonginensis]WBO83165.1 hypothetical protein O9Z63_12330 [Hymenobacter yonginensis]